MTEVVMVAAMATNRVIGRTGGIPWSIPDDFAHFKQVTIGHPLILGRTTFEGIGKPLPGRQSIVVTTNGAWAYPGVLVAATVDEALAIGAGLDERVNIGGGAQLYAAAMPYATHQILTRVHLEPEGDTFYPDFDESQWRMTGHVSHLDDPTPWEIDWLERVDSLGIDH